MFSCETLTQAKIAAGCIFFQRSVLWAHACGSATSELTTTVQGIVSRHFNTASQQRGPTTKGHPPKLPVSVLTLPFQLFLCKTDAHISVLNVLEQEKGTRDCSLAHPRDEEPSSSHCIIRRYRCENPAHSRASRLGTFADPGTPSGYKTGHVWTTPFSNRLFSSH